MPEVLDMTEGLINHKQPVFHFLVENVFEWRTGDDLHLLMKEMDKQKLTYWVWYVPGEKDSQYEIRFYQPQVEGSYVLAQVEAKTKKKSK